MKNTLPTLTIQEWSRVTPAEAALLRGLLLTEADRELLSHLASRTSLRVEELRQGLRIEIGPHVGTITLSSLRIVVLPKLRLGTLMSMIAYAFELAELTLNPLTHSYALAEQGFIDLLGFSLLQAVERIVHGGLLPLYRYRLEELVSPRGRIDMRYSASRPKRAGLRCHFAELTLDHPLHQALAAGLRLAANQVQSTELRLDLIRTANRLFADQRRIRLDSQLLADARASLDRRSRHYETALVLAALLFQGSCVGAFDVAAGVPLAGFLLDMNRLFERFLSRHLHQHAPQAMEVISQDVRADVFAYRENPRGWRNPTLRPDLVFLRRGKTVAIGDAKYRNRHDRPPSAAELYQLTTYALAYPLPQPRQVYLFYPLQAAQEGLYCPAQLLFAPDGAENVCIHLVGVPIDAIVSGQCPDWWPLR